MELSCAPRFLSFIFSNLVFRVSSSLLSLSLSVCCCCFCDALLFCALFCCALLCCALLCCAEKPPCVRPKRPVCAFKTPPWLPAPHAHMHQLVRVVPAYTVTFGTYTRDVLDGHTETLWTDTDTSHRHSTTTTHTTKTINNTTAHQNLPTQGCHALAHFHFENRSRKTCCRFLQLFALPEGKQAERNVTDDLHVSIAAEITLSWSLSQVTRACFEPL